MPFLCVWTVDSELIKLHRLMLTSWTCEDAHVCSTPTWDWQQHERHIWTFSFSRVFSFSGWNTRWSGFRHKDTEVWWTHRTNTSWARPCSWCLHWLQVCVCLSCHFCCHVTFPSVSSFKSFLFYYIFQTFIFSLFFVLFESFVLCSLWFLSFFVCCRFCHATSFSCFYIFT